MGIARLALAALPLMVLLAGPGFAADGATDPLVAPSHVRSVLTKYCADCHAGGADEGNVQFDAIEKLNLATSLELLNKAQDQLFFKTMPPAEEAQPSASERSLLAAWIRGELRKHNASKLDDKLRYPDYGNYIDHETLFSGEIRDEPFTPARRWLVSPQIFHERVMDVFKLTGRERERYTSSSFYGVTNPFVLPEHSGVRYYDLTTLDGGHLLVMLANAEWISKKQVRAARVKNGEIGANEYPDARDRWAPRITPKAFETVILKDTAPTDEELIVAIQTQFDCVLQRPPTDEELSKYLQLTRSAIELAGNTDGLRKMLVAVLLDSEFLYKTKQVVTTGHLDGADDPKLDGEVKDAMDMIDRLAKSERVRQSIIRHAFRFYLGRNEMLSDSQTLIDADKAYVESGGSFKAVIVSLLTSDSFIYRKDAGDQP